MRKISDLPQQIVGANSLHIPELFVKVIKEFHPEIVDVKIEIYEKTSYYLIDLTTRETYRVLIRLIISDKLFKGKMVKEYEESINQLFELTYSEYDFVTFRILSFILDSSNEKLFQDLFFVK